jgi:nucleotidyltransferase substrate binding protein (TIGR01987 family)
MTTILNEIIITPILKASLSLDKVLKEKKDEYIRDAAIQRFEYSFELAWKTMKRILKHKGYEVGGSKDVFRLSAKEGLIDDPITWFGFLEMRNETVHSYDEAKAEKIYENIPHFSKELDKFIKTIKAL